MTGDWDRVAAEHGRRGRAKPAVPPITAMATGIDALGPLQAGDVDVWYVDLTLGRGTVATLRARLAGDERARADRFKFEPDARRFIVTRSALRAVLGTYLAVEPGRLAFSYGPHGKPALEGAHASLQFNVSHSGELALIAAGWRRAVGVDVEQWRPLPDMAAIAARVFAPAERHTLAGLAEAERSAAFFRCWTRKEAFIKATGLGLAQPLDRFVVSLAAHDPVGFLDIDGDPVALARWTLHDLRVPAGYAGALVVEGAPRAMRLRRWAPAEADA
jgi:4'-phosphopantetheinyl transferase